MACILGHSHVGEYLHTCMWSAIRMLAMPPLHNYVHGVCGKIVTACGPLSTSVHFELHRLCLSCLSICTVVLLICVHLYSWNILVQCTLKPCPQKAWGRSCVLLECAQSPDCTTQSKSVYIVDKVYRHTLKLRIALGLH